MAEQGQTPEPTRADPFELWRQMYETNEQAWTKTIKELTSTATYAETQGKMLEVFLNFQKSMRDATTAQMSAYNLATRDDVTGIGELMVGIEEKVDRLDETIAKLEGVVSDQNQRLARMELALRAVESDGKASAKEESESAAPQRSRRASQS